MEGLFRIRRSGLWLHDSTFQALADQASGHKFAALYIHIPLKLTKRVVIFTHIVYGMFWVNLPISRTGCFG
jgi:hypothetical protein